MDWFRFNDERGDSTEHLKDSTFKMIVVGYGIPFCIVVVVVLNLVFGTVLLPEDRVQGDLLGGFVQSYTDAWRVAGVVTSKLGFALALFSWYALANHERTERYAQPALLGSIGVIIIGFVLLGIGFFR